MSGSQILLKLTLNMQSKQVKILFLVASLSICLLYIVRTRFESIKDTRVLNKVDTDHQHFEMSRLNCSVSGVTIFITDFVSGEAEELLSTEVLRINALIDTFMSSSSKHCFVVLTVMNGANALRRFDLDKRASVVEISLPDFLEKQHFFISRWHVMSQFLIKFAQTHIIFLDSDILALYRETDYIFREGDWDIALTVTELPEEQRRINCGVMLVHQNGFKSMILLSSYVINEGLKVLANPEDMEPNLAGEVLFNDQLLVLDFLNKYGNFQVPRFSRIANREAVIENPCLIIDVNKYQHGSGKNIRVLLLNRSEWNGNPVRLQHFTKFSHYKGKRKKYMMEHYRMLKKLGRNFKSSRAHNWCSRTSILEKCKAPRIKFKNSC